MSTGIFIDVSITRRPIPHKFFIFNTVKAHARRKYESPIRRALQKCHCQLILHSDSHTHVSVIPDQGVVPIPLNNGKRGFEFSFGTRAYTFITMMELELSLGLSFGKVFHLRSSGTTKQRN